MARDPDPDLLHRTASRATATAAALELPGSPVLGWQGPARAGYDETVARRVRLVHVVGRGLEALAVALRGAARLSATPLAVRPGLRPGDGTPVPLPEVAVLQRALASAGHRCGPAGADGVLGPATEGALLALQAERGLPSSGVADAATLRALGPGHPGVPVGPVRPVLRPPGALSPHHGPRGNGSLRWRPEEVAAEARSLVTAARQLTAMGALLREVEALTVPLVQVEVVREALAAAAGGLRTLLDELRDSARGLTDAARTQAETERRVLAAVATVAAAAPRAPPTPRVPPPGPRPRPTTEDRSTDLAALARRARRCVGAPYAWGGASPATGFDCSGLVQWVYGQAGVTLPRTSQLQSAAYPLFSDAAALRPGDLVFFGGGAGSATHVALYVGAGQVLHAPGPGERVRVQALWGPWSAAHVPT